MNKKLPPPPPPKATPEDLVKVSATYAAFGIQQNQDPQPALNFQWSQDAMKIIIDALFHSNTSCMDAWPERYDSASGRHLATAILKLIDTVNSKIQELTQADCLAMANLTLADIEQIIRHIAELRDLLTRLGDSSPLPGGYSSRVNHRINPTSKLIKQLRELISSTYGASI